MYKSKEEKTMDHMRTLESEIYKEALEDLTKSSIVSKILYHYGPMIIATIGFCILLGLGGLSNNIRSNQICTYMVTYSSSTGYLDTRYIDMPYDIDRDIVNERVLTGSRGAPIMIKMLDDCK